MRTESRPLRSYHAQTFQLPDRSGNLRPGRSGTYLLLTKDEVLCRASVTVRQQCADNSGLQQARI
jgi:hypothetical protein